MPVDTVHEQYATALGQWARCRDCYNGGDAVKAKGTEYLPPLDVHQTRPTVATLPVPGGATQSVGAGYDAYLARALFYNATGRTVDGLAGAVHQKPPTVKAPTAIEEQLKDVTSSVDAESMEMFALEMLKEVLKVGRFGAFVDMAMQPDNPDGTPAKLDPTMRPYWVKVLCERVINWRVSRIGNVAMLTRVVISEKEEEPDPEDEFAAVCVEQIRVLELVQSGKPAVQGQAQAEPTYVVSVWRKRVEKNEKSGKEEERWEKVHEHVPKRRGKPLSFIPFTFVGPTSVRPEVSKPPMLDVVDVNLSHFRNSADHEHGLHFTGIPIPWVAGVKDEDGPIHLGSSQVLVLGEHGTAGIIQADGALLGALEQALDRKQKMMATLGARLLEEQPTSGTDDTATAVVTRTSGEQASLRTIAGAVEQALTMLVRWHAWWVGTEEKPQDVDAHVELNKEFLQKLLTATDLAGLVQALQAETISYLTFYDAIARGGLARPDVTAEQEQRQIEKEKATREAAEPPPGEGGFGGENGDEVPGMEQGDEMIANENPWRIIKRKGKFLVVKADSGEVVGTHPTEEKARKHLAALHANVDEEDKDDDDKAEDEEE